MFYVMYKYIINDRKIPFFGSLDAKNKDGIILKYYKKDIFLFNFKFRLKD